MSKKYMDRHEAGQRLAAELEDLQDKRDLLVLALPRGGVPVALEVAAALSAPLDIFLVRKLGVPGREELAMGAIAEGGQRVVNQHVMNRLGIGLDTLDGVALEENRELERRARIYRGGLMPLRIADANVVLVDDGLATGASMVVAVKAVRQFEPRSITVAVPVGPPESCEHLEQYADQVVCPLQPQDFMSVGGWYEDFSQTTDDEVRMLLAQYRARSYRPTGSEGEA